jgi:hypothetical protein
MPVFCSAQPHRPTVPQCANAASLTLKADNLLMRARIFAFAASGSVPSTAERSHSSFASVNQQLIGQGAGQLHQKPRRALIPG